MSDHDSGSEGAPNDTDVYGTMLNSVLANHFEYVHSDGNALNLAEILLLIKQSIDENTKAIHELVDVTKYRS